MEFQLSEDLATTAKWAHEFAEKEIRPVAPEYDESEEFPWPVVKKAAEVGLYSLDFYTETVAQDPSGITLPLVLEELAWGCAGIGLGIFGTGLPLSALAYSGTPEQFLTWAPKMFGTPDDPKVGSFCVTEPDAGSDVSALKTTARYDEAKDEWVLNGQKAWATNGGIAAVHVVIASVDRELGARGQAAFVVPPGTTGLTMGTKVRKHGLRASHTADVFLDDCRVSGACLLGGKEKLDER